MTDVAAWILHPLPPPTAGPLVRWVTDERAAIAERHRVGFERAGAAVARIVAGPPDDTPFGARLRALVTGDGTVKAPGGAIVLGSGAAPLALLADRRAFVETAAAPRPVALANNRFSADIVAIACAERLAGLPDLPADNALPRWLDEVAGYEVSDLRRRWRLAIDVDGPLDLLFVDGPEAMDRAGRRGIDLGPVNDRLAAVTSAGRDRRAEVLVSGRTSAAAVARLERGFAARVRALVEERGMRAASRLAQTPGDGPGTRTSIEPRPPASVLGLLLDRDGPGSLGLHLARLADAALVDSRVLLAHHFGPDERSWPVAGDRFASDLLLVEDIADPWLRELTDAARSAAIPVVLGGHTLVGPGLWRLAGSRSWS